MLPELWECTLRTIFVLTSCDFPAGAAGAPRTTFVLKSCDFPAGAAGARSAYYVCTKKLRFSSRSCRSTLRVLRLYLKAATFKPEQPRTRGGIERDCESRRANHETTSKDHFASNKTARRHSESASTRTIPAEGSPRLRRIRTAPQRERFDHADPRRGSRGNIKKCKNPRVFAPRPRRSPQRVHPGTAKTQKTSSFCTSTTPISAEGRAGISKNAKILEFLHLDHADLRRGSRGHITKNAKNLEFLHLGLDHADLRRGSRGHIKKRKHPRVFAPRPRRSPQRVAFPIVGNIPTPRLKRDS